MRYFNETEKRLAERYHHMELGTCKICEECQKNVTRKNIYPYRLAAGA